MKRPTTKKQKHNTEPLVLDAETAAKLRAIVRAHMFKDPPAPRRYLADMVELYAAHLLNRTMQAALDKLPAQLARTAASVREQMTEFQTIVKALERS